MLGVVSYVIDGVLAVLLVIILCRWSVVVRMLSIGFAVDQVVADLEVCDGVNDEGVT